MTTIYFEDGRNLGIIERSDCGNLKLVVQYEPYISLLNNVLTDYSLRHAYGINSYAIRESTDLLTVYALSSLQSGLLVAIAQIDKDNNHLSLCRVRPAYKRPGNVGKRALKKIQHLPKNTPVLVSACLLGEPCRYDACPKLHESVAKLGQNLRIITICPETAGGLPTPRPPAERMGANIITQDGVQVRPAFEKGAIEALKLAEEHQIEYAILKSKSPSCGIGKIYDGTFTHTLIKGNGLCAERLIESGISCISELDLDA